MTYGKDCIKQAELVQQDWPHKDDWLYVGVDVHKKSYAVAIWLNDTLAVDFVLPADG